MLILYKPFTGPSEDALKEDEELSEEALLGFITDPFFSCLLRQRSSARNRATNINREEGDMYQTAGNQVLPNEEERKHELNEEAQSTVAAKSPDNDDNDYKKYDDDVQDAQFNEGDLSGFDRGRNIDWSDGYQASGHTYLVEHTKRYYSVQRSASFREPFSLFDPNVYIPENCQGFAQTLLVCATLYIVKQYTDNPLLLQDPNHPCWNFFTQVNSGSGKAFVIMTILNCTRALCGCMMECAASVAPTGWAASLSNGRTSHRFFNFPTGKKINKQPYDSKTSKIAHAQAFLNQMEALSALVSDEFRP
jgi:hypothetical protein